MVFFKPEVVQLGIAAVAYAMHIFVGLRHHSASLRTNVANACTTPLAVSDWILAKTAGEKSVADLAVRSRLTFFLDSL